MFWTHLYISSYMTKYQIILPKNSNRKMMLYFVLPPMYQCITSRLYNLLNMDTLVSLIWTIQQKKVHFFVQRHVHITFHITYCKRDLIIGEKIHICILTLWTRRYLFWTALSSNISLW